MPFNPDVTPNSLYHPDYPIGAKWENPATREVRRNPDYVNTKKRYDQLTSEGYVEFRDLANKPEYPKIVGYLVGSGKSLVVNSREDESQYEQGVHFTKEKPAALTLDPEAENQALRDELEDLKSRFNMLMDQLGGPKEKGKVGRPKSAA